MQMGQGNSTEVAKSLQTVVPLAQGAVEEVRRISRNLRPSILDDLGIIQAISASCKEFAKTYSGIVIEKQIDIKESDVRDSLKIVIFRVFQEALNNVAKHSQANLVRVSLGGTDGKIELTIKDDGVGFQAEHMLSSDQIDRGLGITSMKERIEFSGGSFLIESRTGAGTTVRASWEC